MGLIAHHSFTVQLVQIDNNVLVLCFVFKTDFWFLSILFFSYFYKFMYLLVFFDTFAIALRFLKATF